MTQRSSSATWGATLLLFFAIAGLWLAGAFERVGEDGPSLGVGGSAEAADVVAESIEVEAREAAALAPGDPAGLARSEGAEREAVGAPSEAAEGLAVPSAPSIPLHGVVLDPLGRTVPGVLVEWIAAAPPIEAVDEAPSGPRIGGPDRFPRSGRPPATAGPGGGISINQDLGTVVSLNDLSGWSRSSRHPRVRTDRDGAFEFAGVPARSEGTLRFGHELLAGAPASQRVIPDGGEQSLFLPARPAETPLVRIELRDGESGRELYPDRVAPRLVRLPDAILDPAGTGEELPRRALKVPREDQIERGTGWVELRLWPGLWRVELSSTLSETVEVEVNVPRTGELILATADLRVFDPERGWEPLSPVLEEGFEPRPEAAEGFDLYGADKSPTRQVGERNSDRTFRHTLRFGVGEVQSAYLELDLEAVSGMSYNDSLGLEFYAGPRFGFSNRISAFTGGNWRAPTRRRLMIDLANIPGTKGPINILPDLADGRLDVYVQDDTAVYDVRLFVQR